MASEWEEGGKRGLSRSHRDIQRRRRTRSLSRFFFSPHLPLSHTHNPHSLSQARVVLFGSGCLAAEVRWVKRGGETICPHLLFPRLFGFFTSTHHSHHPTDRQKPGPGRRRPPGPGGRWRDAASGCGGVGGQPSAARQLFGGRVRRPASPRVEVRDRESGVCVCVCVCVCVLFSFSFFSHQPPSPQHTQCRRRHRHRPARDEPPRRCDRAAFTPPPTRLPGGRAQWGGGGHCRWRPPHAGSDHHVRSGRRRRRH